VTKDDWQALFEDYLAGDSDIETFKDAFLEAMKEARAEKARIPSSVEEFAFEIEPFDVAEDEESDIRDEAEKVLEKLTKSA
jgi:vacuolar-type H+-ATPase subunit H